uniref:Tail protein n=1 Tax=viral metagenome TaxID=1070528 RepID=A0A6M3XUG3_9ZZZZ
MAQIGRTVRVEVGLAGGLARSWDGLRTAFSVERTSTRAPNSAKVTLYNLSRDSAAWCRRPGQVLRLSAGYEVPSQLFLGDIDRAERSEAAADCTVEIEATDGGRRFREARISRSYSLEVTASLVLADLATALGVPLGSLGALGDVRMGEGLTLVGPVRDNLDRMAILLNAHWSIQDGALQVLGDSDIRAQVGPLLTPQTGLVGSPRPVKDSKKKGQIEVVCLLRPEILPGTRFGLQSRDFSGFYRAEDVKHAGDTHGGEWYTTISARES